MRDILPKFLLTLLIIGLLSCKSNTSSEKKTIKWKSIVLRIDNKQIVLSNSDDSLLFKKWDYRDSSCINKMYRIPINIEIEKIKITHQEADSIYKWTKMLITEIIDPQSFCTDYVGYVKFTIVSSDQITQSCEYTSICDWLNLGHETTKLDLMFKEKFKKYK